MAERTTPEEPLEDAVDDTPEGEPAVEDEPEEAPDQSPASGRIAQAEYTRATQLAANVRRTLGLPKTATQAEVIAAIEARSQAQATDDADEADELTERERELLERSRAAELRVQSSVYGDEFTTDAVALINLARQSDDLEELIAGFAAFRDAHGGPFDAEGDDEGEEGDEDEAEDEEAAGIDTSEGDRAPRTSTPSGGRRESGVVGALRGIFAAVEEQRRTRS